MSQVRLAAQRGIRAVQHLRPSARRVTPSANREPAGVPQLPCAARARKPRLGERLGHPFQNREGRAHGSAQPWPAGGLNLLGDLQHHDPRRENTRDLLADPFPHRGGAQPEAALRGGDEQGGALLIVEGISDSTRTRLEQSAPNLREQFQQMGLELQLDMRQNNQSASSNMSNFADSQDRGNQTHQGIHSKLDPTNPLTQREMGILRARETGSNQVYLYA